MQPTPEHNEKMAKMTFATVYPLYLAKLERKGRRKEELHQVIEWLTGFNDDMISKLIDGHATFEAFFCTSSTKPQCAPNNRFDMWLQD